MSETGWCWSFHRSYLYFVVDPLNKIFPLCDNKRNLNRLKYVTHDAKNHQNPFNPMLRFPPLRIRNFSKL